jgi:hypothetical protein
MLSRYISKDAAITQSTSNLFGKGMHERLANIAVLLERHGNANPHEENANESMLGQIARGFDHTRIGLSKVATPALWNIGNLIRDGRDIRGRPSKKLQKPKVHMYVELMKKGELSIIFDHDEDDFIADGIYDMPYYTRRPINEVFHLYDFNDYMRWATRKDLDEWDSAMAFHIVTTLNEGLQDLIKDVGEYCAVTVGKELFISPGETKNCVRRWELTTKLERDGREALNQISEIDRRLDAVKESHGMIAEKLVVFVDERRKAKPQPTYRMIEEELRVDEKILGSLAKLIRDLKNGFHKRGELALVAEAARYGVTPRPCAPFHD